MRFALVIVVALTLLGCSGQNARPFPTAPSASISTTPNPPAPTAPDPPAATIPDPPARPARLTFVWVAVIGESLWGGLCVPGATVEIVGGQGLGRRLTQTTRGCTTWDPDYEMIFDGLNEGEEVTLRASASGYASKEITVIPTFGGQSAVSITLSKVQ